MSNMKRVVEEVVSLYQQGYSILAIARQLKLSTQAVQYAVNTYI
jgi:DNA-binding NarL/FixJ family response regulator